MNKKTAYTEEIELEYLSNYQGTTRHKQHQRIFNDFALSIFVDYTVLYETVVVVHANKYDN